MNEDLGDYSIIDYGYFSNSIGEYDCCTNVVPFDSVQGKNYFLQSNFKNSFFKLAPHYAPQQHITTCGIASVAIVLNTIYATNNFKRPLDEDSCFYMASSKKKFANFIWNETNFFTEKVKLILDKNIITGNKLINGEYALGVSMIQLSEAINLHGVKASYYFADNISEKDISQFRELVKSITYNPKKYMIANYHIGIQFPNLNSGHFSPIAAYDEFSDYLLILDTWAASTPWVWINLTDFYKSMHSLDGDEYRGYIIIEV